MNNFKVYVHIFPNAKLYFGITSQNPKNRWYSNGSGYKNCPLVYKAIKKYGWNNVKHLILFDNLTKENAISLEKYLIKLFNTNNSEFGYNLTSGGDGTSGYFPDELVRRKMSKAMIGKNPLSKKSICWWCRISKCRRMWEKTRNTTSYVISLFER